MRDNLSEHVCFTRAYKITLLSSGVSPFWIWFAIKAFAIYKVLEIIRIAPLCRYFAEMASQFEQYILSLVWIDVYRQKTFYVNVRLRMYKHCYSNADAIYAMCLL